MSTIRAFGEANTIQASASPSVPQGTALGTKLSTRLEEFTQGKDA